MMTTAQSTHSHCCIFLSWYFLKDTVYIIVCDFILFCLQRTVSGLVIVWVNPKCFSVHSSKVWRLKTCHTNLFLTKLFLSFMGPKCRFMKFNNRFLRRILIRDNRAESSIVALYKKLELQNAMEILDTVSGDTSAAPSIVSLQYKTWILSHTVCLFAVQINGRVINLFSLWISTGTLILVKKSEILLNLRRNFWLKTWRTCTKSCPRTCTRSGNGWEYFFLFILLFT